MQDRYESCIILGRVLWYNLIHDLSFTSQIIDPGRINPETPKMPQKLVDRIPLVLYIPSPEPGATSAATGKEKRAVVVTSSEIVPVDERGIIKEVENRVGEPGTEQDIAEAAGANMPEATVEGALARQDQPQYPDTYPPPPIIVVRYASSSIEDPHPSREATGALHATPSHTATSPPTSLQPTATPTATPSATIGQPAPIPSASSLPPNPRFTFLRILPRKKTKTKISASSSSPTSPKHGHAGNAGEADVEGEEDEEVWEDRWEKAALPFVRLEGNRAVCAICLMDFAEPRRRQNKNKGKGKTSPTTSATDAASSSRGQGVEVLQKEETESKKDEDPEPLRLLECGHVFHVRLPPCWRDFVD